jgi:hypothetical protein
LSFKSSSFLLLLLRLLWVCGQRVCVVQAKRHIHSPRRLDPIPAGTPCRHGKLVVHRLMRATMIVQRGLRTPTGPFFARFFIGIILGLVAEFAFMGQSTKLVMSSSAAR